MKISFMAASEPAPRITHEDVATPVAWGESRRNDLPCEAPGAWSPTSARPDPIALLREQESTRLLQPYSMTCW
jgi:hypothetical protein